MDAGDILVANVAVAAVCFTALWLIALWLQDVSFVDVWWALGMVLMAWTTLLLQEERGPHAIALVGLCTAWGLRLGLYLFWRWRAYGPDRRYLALIGRAGAERGWSFAKASLMLVFAFQAPMQLVVALPVILGQAPAPHALGPVAWIGVAIAIVGIGLESLADFQLVRFRAGPDAADKVLDSGVWRYSRHPNYFGDACVWWGLFLIAADSGWIGLAALPGRAAAHLPTPRLERRAQHRGADRPATTGL
jgi:steroid 5-alpha reductase family enzyme